MVLKRNASSVRSSLFPDFSKCGKNRNQEVGLLLETLQNGFVLRFENADETGFLE